jgi:DNA-binding SARP family transcriptional activator/tetratricopeptide (TPR) repeat protein
VRVLGPVEVVGPGGAAALPGSRQRALVGLLALRSGQVVPRSSLVDALWGEDPPRTAIKTLYSHVTRVRQAMEACGLPGVLSTREPGYVLDLPSDAQEFSDLVRQGGVAGLTAGLALWRGDPFADSAVAGWGEAEVVRLRELRLTAVEELWSLRLEGGEHAPAVDALEPLVSAHPYRERLTSLLMLALYRCGRPADALDRYQRLRACLADELGVDPGPSLQRRYEAILRHDPSLDAVVTPRPAQLPAPVGHFTGRTAELATLSTMDAVGIAALSGPAGMGKTALAVHWAQSARPSYPDGQLYLDMRGASADPMSVSEALPHLLRSLGVPGDRIPSTVDEQAGLYRSVLHGRRVLIVLDNCRGAAQVLPLVPGSTSSFLLVTSRTALTALAAHHAVRLISLDVLDAPAAVSLVDKVCGVPQDPEGLASLVDLCGRMPLALRIAAASVATSALPSVVGRLRRGRLDALALEGDSRTVRTVFDSAYAIAAPAAAEVFRLLGVCPAVSMSADVAAAVTELPVARAAALCADLAAAHLLTVAGADRYGFHDLIRLYAAECAHAEPAGRRSEVLDRAVDWYLAAAEHANGVLQPSRNRVVPSLKYRPLTLPMDATHDSVLGFLDVERENILPVIRRAGPTATWQLTYLLAGFYEFRGHWSERIDMCRLAVAAARTDRDPFAESLMCSSLGGAYNAVHRFAEALPPLERSLALALELGDRRGVGNAHNNLAWAYTGLSRPADAITSFEAALALYTAENLRVPRAMVLNNLAETHVNTGRTAAGFSYFAQALAEVRSVGDPRLVAAVTHSIGEAHLRQGDLTAAEAALTEALSLRQHVGDHRHAAESLMHLGLARRSVPTLAQAVEACRETGNEHLEAVALHHLATAYAAVNDPPSAAMCVRQALSLRTRIPDSAEESGLRDLLASLAPHTRAPAAPPC